MTVSEKDNIEAPSSEWGGDSLNRPDRFSGINTRLFLTNNTDLRVKQVDRLADYVSTVWICGIIGQGRTSCACSHMRFQKPAFKHPGSLGVVN